MTAKEAATECRQERQDKGADEFAKEWDEGGPPFANCTKVELEDDAASNALSSVGVRGLSFGFELAGRLGLAVALLYTCLYAMRVGLLSRFWGSLGMALGVASLILAPIFVLIFFIYFGLLAIGKLPGGRPPAWAAGEAIPWPTPGEKAAQEMQPEDPSAEVVTAPELQKGEGDDGEAEGADSGESGEKPSDGGSEPQRRKRKRRG